MIHAICGLQNDGKTLYASWLAKKDFLEGRIIFSNYKLAFKHILVNKDFIIWLGKAQPSFQNATFVLDELWLWLDCRGMMIGKGTENTISTYFFLQSSKSNANIYLTSQSLYQTEVRIRDNLHRYSECKRVLRVGNAFKRVISDRRNLGKSLNDALYIEVKTYDRCLQMNMNSFKLKRRQFIKADRLFSLYDTYEKKVIV